MTVFPLRFSKSTIKRERLEFEEKDYGAFLKRHFIRTDTDVNMMEFYIALYRKFRISH